MSPRLIKGIMGAIGLGGAVVGGYYAVETLTDERVPSKILFEKN